MAPTTKYKGRVMAGTYELAITAPAITESAGKIIFPSRKPMALANGIIKNNRIHKNRNG